MCLWSYVIGWADKIQQSFHLAVVLEDICGSSEVQHPVDDQLTVAGKLVTLLLKKTYLHLLLALS